jgi:hypothetical protein
MNPRIEGRIRREELLRAVPRLHVVRDDLVRGAHGRQRGLAREILRVSTWKHAESSRIQMPRPCVPSTSALSRA